MSGCRSRSRVTWRAVIPPDNRSAAAPAAPPPPPPPASPARAVQRDDLLPRDREHPERITAPQVVLAGHREPGQVRQRDVRAAGDARVLEPPRLDPAGGEQPADQAAQPGLLQLGELLGWHRLRLRLKHGHRYFLGHVLHSRARPPSAPPKPRPRGCACVIFFGGGLSVDRAENPPRQAIRNGRGAKRIEILRVWPYHGCM